MTRPITAALGDGIGPEIMRAVLTILEKAGADIQPEFVEIGEPVYKKGTLTGIEDKTWESLYKNKIFLKAPITTPQGGGFKSLNVAVRKTLGLFANVRHCTSYFPYVPTKHKNLDLVIVRENEEDLYTGIEHRQTEQVYQCLKLVSKNNCERISHFAFEYALNQNRKKVTCFTKDNIMKMTDGLLHKTFLDQSKNYPSITAEHWIIDIGSAKLADTPENFDVIVTSNLYGDILSDVAAQLSGSVAMGASCNIGEEYAMFEAIHGSAPRRAGQNMANPSGLLLAAVNLLVHIEQIETAKKIKNAWLKTLEDGLHTYDIFKKDIGKKQLGTKEFAQAVVHRLGEQPSVLPPADYQNFKKIRPFIPKKRTSIKKEWAGADIFFEKSETDVSSLVPLLQKFNTHLKLSSLKCRGLEVWPGPPTQISLSDHWGARFVSDRPVSAQEVYDLMLKLAENNLTCIKMEGLFLFDKTPGFYMKKPPAD